MKRRFGKSSIEKQGPITRHHGDMRKRAHFIVIHRSLCAVESFVMKKRPNVIDFEGNPRYRLGSIAEPEENRSNVQILF